MAQIGTNTREATWWPKLKPMQVKIEEEKKLKNKIEEQKVEKKLKKVEKILKKS